MYFLKTGLKIYFLSIVINILVNINNMCIKLRLKAKKQLRNKTLILLSFCIYNYTIKLQKLQELFDKNYLKIKNTS